VQNRAAVVADGCDAQAEALELITIFFQLHELGFAIGSPVG
jgi:hypothetical protein